MKFNVCDKHHCSENGSVKLKVKVPDTITSWVLSGFSVNKQLGLGISDSPAKVTNGWNVQLSFPTLLALFSTN